MQRLKLYIYHHHTVQVARVQVQYIYKLYSYM